MKSASNEKLAVDVEQVDQFVYLGRLITADGKSKRDIQRTMGHTSQAFGQMNKTWRSREITIHRYPNNSVKERTLSRLSSGLVE